MDETKTVPISYTKFEVDVSRLDELLVIKPEKILCYSESFCLKSNKPLFIICLIFYLETITHLLPSRADSSLNL